VAALSSPGAEPRAGGGRKRFARSGAWRVRERAYLALADGTLWPGAALGKRGRTEGEVVFNTSMTGYQEVLTDPSYRRQIVVMTAPHIGNTGVNDQDDESARPWVAGFAVARASLSTSSWRASGTLDEYLDRHGVVGITELDTRALVRHIRTGGAIHGALVSDGGSTAEALEAARAAADINEMDLVGEVTCAEAHEWSEPADAMWYPLGIGMNRGVAVDSGAQGAHAQGTGAGANGAGGSLETGAANLERSSQGRPHIVVYDLGVKRTTLRLLAAQGCRVTVVPARTPADSALELEPDGVLLSNGPGDPARLSDIVNIVRDLLDRVPVYGICLGHQLLGLALGCGTYKLCFGHRGANQPVRHPDGGRVEISSHNHGFAIDPETLLPSVRVTRVNLSDGCIEGLSADDRQAASVQYHPESAPGPHDSLHLLAEFVDSVR